ncbi:hypothetical protein Tco_1290017, partial [Tanacetum coccineum]
FESPYNLLLGRADMQRMGIVVSTIYAAIKFQTPNRVGIMYLSYSAWRVEDAYKKVRERSPEPPKVILNCLDAEEKVVISDLHPERL